MSGCGDGVGAKSVGGRKPQRQIDRGVTMVGQCTLGKSKGLRQADGS